MCSQIDICVQIFFLKCHFDTVNLIRSKYSSYVHWVYENRDPKLPPTVLYSVYVYKTAPS